MPPSLLVYYLIPTNILYQTSNLYAFLCSYCLLKEKLPYVWKIWLRTIMCTWVHRTQGTRKKRIRRSAYLDRIANVNPSNISFFPSHYGFAFFCVNMHICSVACIAGDESIVTIRRLFSYVYRCNMRLAWFCSSFVMLCVMGEWNSKGINLPHNNDVHTCGTTILRNTFD